MSSSTSTSTFECPECGAAVGVTMTIEQLVNLVANGTGTDAAVVRGVVAEVDGLGLLVRNREQQP